MSSPSARSLSSTAPSRTSTDSEIERTATASAASAPARRAALTRRSARSMSGDWSSSDDIGWFGVGSAIGTGKSADEAHLGRAGRMLVSARLSASAQFYASHRDRDKSRERGNTPSIMSLEQGAATGR